MKQVYLINLLPPLYQSKWLKFLSEGNIKIRKDLYTLKVTDNKRKLVFNENNKFIDTTPYIINKNKEIIK